MTLRWPRPLPTSAVLRRGSAALVFAVASGCAHAAAAPAQCRARPASPPCHRARAAEAAPRQQAPPPPLERTTLRLQLGMGGGALGVAPRIGAEALYWALPQLAVGATASLLADTQLLASGYERALYAPMVALRTKPNWLYGFASAAAGVASIDYAGGLGSQSKLGLGMSAALGFMGHREWHELGASVMLDLLTQRLPGRSTLPYAITLNVVLGLFL